MPSERAESENAQPTAAERSAQIEEGALREAARREQEIDQLIETGDFSGAIRQIKEELALDNSSLRTEMEGMQRIAEGMIAALARRNEELSRVDQEVRERRRRLFGQLEQIADRMQTRE